MEDLVAGFQGAFSVAVDPYDPSRPHPRFSQYKVKREGYGDQEARRKKALEEQCLRRKDFCDLSRRIVEGDLISDDEMEEGGFDEIDGEMDSSTNPSNAKKKKAPYRNQLMLSEWLVDIPKDFQENWFMVVCPIAKRCLVLSAKGSTTAYSRSGHFMRQFSSHFPGGSRKTYHGKNEYCILDCLFDETTQTFFILDVMCWAGHPVYDSDTEFRFYWLNVKISELDHDVVAQTKTNPYKFILLQYHSCHVDSLAKVFSSSWPVHIDGLLFFHKQARYYIGRSPLVLWLKPHMVREIIGMNVSQEFLDSAPVLSNVEMKAVREDRSSPKQSKPKTKIESKFMET